MAILSPSAYLAWDARDMPHLGHSHDDSIYWVCAKSLAEGQGYRILSLPGRPCQTKYPPLHPWLLAWVWKLNPVFPENLPWAMLVAWLALPLFLILAKRTFSELGLGPLEGWALCALLAVNPYVVLYSTRLRTELLFSSLLMAALLVSGGAGGPRLASWRPLAAGLLGGAAYLARSSGIALLVAVPLCYWLRKRPREAALFAAGMLPAVVGWSLWVKAHQSASTDFITLYYTNYLGFHLANFTWRDLPVLLWNNLVGLVQGTGGLHLYGVRESATGLAGSLLLGAATIAGCVRLFRRGVADRYAWLLVVSVVMYLLWHVGPGDEYERLLVPLAPILLAGLTTQLRRMVEWARGSLRRGGLSVVATGLAAIAVTWAAGATALSSLAVIAHMPAGAAPNRAGLADDQAAYAWIKRNLPADARILARQDVVTYLYTGRQACALVLPPRPLYYRDHAQVLRWYGAFPEFMRSHGLQYLITHWLDLPAETLDAQGLRHMRSLISRSPDLRVVYRSSRISIYALQPYNPAQEAESGQPARMMHRFQATSPAYQ